MEELEGNLMDSAGDSYIPEGSTWTHSNESKFGSGGSQLFSSLGYMEIHDLPSLNEFTIEWWQKDLQANGDGGIILTDINNNSISLSPLSNSSTEWRHVAVVRDSDNAVRIYINGTLVDTTEFAGTIDAPVTFYGLQGSMSGKVRYIDELAIFNYSRYSDNFSPETSPYSGGKEKPTNYVYYGYIVDNNIISVTDITEDHLNQLKSSPVMEGAVRISDIPAGAFTVVLIPNNEKMAAYKKNCCNPTDEFTTNTGSNVTGANGSVITVNEVSYKVYGELNLINNNTIVVIKNSEDIPDAGYVNGVLYTMVDEGEYISDELTPMGYNAVTVSGSAADGVYVYDDITGTWSR
jgi:hypothetical protein